jgi:hypothetical protein
MRDDAQLDDLPMPAAPRSPASLRRQLLTTDTISARQARAVLNPGTFEEELSLHEDCGAILDIPLGNRQMPVSRTAVIRFENTWKATGGPHGGYQ